MIDYRLKNRALAISIGGSVYQASITFDSTGLKIKFQGFDADGEIIEHTQEIPFEFRVTVDDETDLIVKFEEKGLRAKVYNIAKDGIVTNEKFRPYKHMRKA